MRIVCRLFVCLLLCAFVCSAKATKINILDPTGPAFIQNAPFQVGFTDSCALDLGIPDQGAPMGCYSFINRTDSPWVGLELVLTDPTQSFAFTCNDSPDGTPVFAQSSCTYNASTDQYVLTFFDGVIPNTGTQFFVISEDDLDPDSLTFEAIPILAAVTPEPPAILLLSTGLLGAAFLLQKRRRAQA